MNEKQFLEEYNPKAYRTPDGLPVDICIFTITSRKEKSARKTLPIRELKVLLIKRKDHPYKDKWAFPGGFSEETENLYQAAKRELKEETNVGDDFHLEQLKTVYYPGRDPRPNPSKTGTAWMPTAVYYAFVKEEVLQQLQAGDDAKEAKLFTIEEAKQLEFAFDHGKILFGGLKDLAGEEVEAYQFIQKKMLQTTIAKEFLPLEFTLSELRGVIEAVFPTFKVAPSNFIQKMLGTKSRQGIIEEVLDANGEVKKSTEHANNPTKLYQFTGYEPMLSMYNATV